MKPISSKISVYYKDFAKYHRKVCTQVCYCLQPLINKVIIITIIVIIIKTHPKHLNKIMISESEWDVSDMKSLWSGVAILYKQVSSSLLKLMSLQL